MTCHTRFVTAQTGSFQLGYSFYYWDFYKTNNSELYVHPKYATFKEEISNYQVENFNEYRISCDKKISMSGCKCDRKEHILNKKVIDSKIF